MAENLKECRVCCLSPWAQLQDLCRLQRVRCRALGVTRRNLADFEVELLCNYRRVRDEEWYLVKWRGYPASASTWEPRRNLRCRGLLRQLHADLARAPGGPVRAGPRGLPPRALRFLARKAEQRRALRRWERALNRRRGHRGRIAVENDVDLHGPPQDFVYGNEYKVGAGVSLTPVAVGCECRDCLAEAAAGGGCCPGASHNRFAYNELGQVRIRAGLPIYECNSRCRCGADCPNRVVQRGIRYDLCIFRTADGRGWGVRTLQRIRKNSFVMEYVGEIITSEEAERRGQVYDRQGATYLFDLDYVEDVYTVDAAHYGNISHFVNHSCDPNLQVYNVFIENLDQRLPRIALFATRPIRAGEELTFDYNMHVDPVDAESTRMDSNFGLVGGSLGGSPRARRRIECKCGAASCRKYLF
ncbi:histone-lysine N-methyltransferase SUV39H1 isoform X3 [Manacus candei]|uniref:histone-lysine N-methyltransferase SUV39H1 isoform X1 n=1 Tax=Manacus candei TaxID=415023 RepID=UPI00222654E7|nr:histone-lysine N-methyltransferase SUV39H1 isoform X1 [Manacus candei]XP_051632453.1 histone-lysine N-methyltransferase SUV39H1 isoform X2 [Manacus candei]XP_051632454.1 histone-lysine N-methyltransferase SUV39H1 isoform X3 [Manacus candei]